MSSFSSAGAFSGGESDGLKAGIEAAMQVMNQNKNVHDHMPKQATPETVDAAAKEVGTAMTIVDKNKIITNHYNNLGLESDQKTNQSLAAFERAVIKRLGR